MAKKKNITKSSRHHKIIGSYGEWVICNWLSRSNFEVSIVDHTGIDIVAYNSKTKSRLGISVKSRTRLDKTENESVNLFSNKQNSQDRLKIKNACEAFGCAPWIGVYVETKDGADIFLTSLENYDKKYRIKNKVIDDWKMSDKYLEKYNLDPEVMNISINFSIITWF